MASLVPQQEQESTVDANTLLTDLDKGLRSTRSGEQCEAIVRFPWLLERYPFPILVNSASLKLADVFRNGSNFCRLLILRVIQQTERHLDKISNTEEFIRRIFSVSFSNDPVARALTLRTLAGISSIAYDRKNIQHCIRDSLDSHDEIEVSAAIVAAASYAKTDKEFALNIYPKVLGMIHRLETEPEQKTKLLSILHHNHYDSVLAREVCLQCINLLASHPSDTFVCAALDTISVVGSSSFSLLPSNVSLMIEFFRKDYRIVVRRRALQKALSLARSSPHLWTVSNFESIVSVAEDLSDASDNLNHSFFILVMKNISELVKCPCLLTSDLEARKELLKRTFKLCLSIVYNSPNSRLSSSSIAFEILTSLSSNHEETIALEEVVCAVQSFILSTAMTMDSDSQDIKSFASFCRTCVQLCQREDSIKSRLVTSLQFALSCESLPRWQLKPMIETLCAVTVSDDDGSFIEILNDLLEQSSDLSDSDIVGVMTLYFQTLMVSGNDCQLDLTSVLRGRSLWTFYQTARQAIRYGHYSTCKGLCDQLARCSSLESVSFWMRCLSKVAEAESGLSKCKDCVSLDKTLSHAIALYVEASSSLKTVASFGHSLAFQSKYLQLRLQLLQGLESLRQACKLVRTSPAPAVAAAVAMAARDDLLKYGSIVTQMRKCSKEFRVLSDSYSLLFQSSFNADNQTLSHLQLMQNSCTMIAEAVESLFQTNRMSSLIVDKNTHMEKTSQETRGPSVEHKALIQACHSISSTVAQDLTNRKTVKIESRHIQILEGMTQELLSVPLSIPRLFFQAVQNLSLKLALSPQPKTSGDFVIVFSSNNFALKIEGVVVSSGKRDTRKVSKVMLNVMTSPTAASKAESSRQTEVNLSSVVIPRNDYFQSQFLLNFPCPGLNLVSVEASIIDENEAQWKTGPVVSTTIKVVDDGKS